MSKTKNDEILQNVGLCVWGRAGRERRSKLSTPCTRPAELCDRRRFVENDSYVEILYSLEVESSKKWRRLSRDDPDGPVAEKVVLAWHLWLSLQFRRQQLELGLSL